MSVPLDGLLLEVVHLLNLLREHLLPVHALLCLHAAPKYVFVLVLLDIPSFLCM